MGPCTAEPLWGRRRESVWVGGWGLGAGVGGLRPLPAVIRPRGRVWGAVLQQGHARLAGIAVPSFAKHTIYANDHKTQTTPPQNQTVNGPFSVLFFLVGTSPSGQPCCGIHTVRIIHYNPKNWVLW